MPKIENIIANFCTKHELPKHYYGIAHDYISPIAEQLENLQNKTQPLIVGINGCQGSGKSTCAELLSIILSEVYKLNVLNISLDDFYHTQETRKKLSQYIHPLLKTRGVPGTHDIDLLKHIIKQSKSSLPFLAPKFDKSIDDRLPVEQWTSHSKKIDIVLLEGWCIGAKPQSKNDLETPVNNLEQGEDPKSIWRTYVNTKLKAEYQDIFSQIDFLIMLKAPSFKYVYQWRSKQEEKLKKQTQASSKLKIMDDKAIKRFIEHYQRLTEHMLRNLPNEANIVLELNDEHNIEKRINAMQ